jgi:hypothetical protein
MSSNSVGHLITKTIIILQHFATLHHASSDYTTLIDTSLLSLTLQNPLIWFNPITFPTVRFVIGYDLAIPSFIEQHDKLYS